MIISKDKRRNNIAEYILYMWQIEDIVRSLGFDLKKIEQTVIAQFKVSDENRAAYTNWYANLITLMKEENLEKDGHLRFLMDTIREVNDIHLRLMNMDTHTEYQKIYQQAKPNIEALSLKSPNANNEIEVCLRGLYGILVLKLQQKEISKETQEAIGTISNFLANLSAKFKMYEEGKIEIE